MTRSFYPLPIGTIWILLSWALLWPKLLHAGMPHEDCREPFIYRDAAVNVVVLPYRYVGEGKPLMTETGVRLAMLTQLYSLLHMLRYGSVGAVQMEMPPGQENDPRCEPSQVWDKVMGRMPGAAERLAPKHGLVMVWGLLYEEGDDIYVKSYARFARKEVPEDIKFRASEVEFVVRPSSETVSFEPQLLKREDLKRIESGYQSANVVRPSPNEAAPGQPLPNFVRKCAGCPVPTPGYFVEEQKGDWIRVRWIDRMLGSKDGWIRAETRLSGRSLDELMPELDFVQGLVGYLRYRIGEQSGIPPAAENTVASDLADFGRFREKSKTDGSQSAYALSLELSGMMLALREGPGDLTQAAESVRQAAILEPENGATRNLSACLQIWHEWKTSKLGLHARAQADQLIAATVLDAHSNTSLLNLRGLYQLLLNAPQAGRESGFSPQEIQQRLHNINAVKPVSGPELLNR